MIPDPALLPAPVAAVLEEAAGALARAGVSCAVGGSAMVRMLGGEVAVGDVDLLVAASEQEAVAAAVAAWNPVLSRGGPEPWHSAWRIRCTGHPVGVPLDVIGGMRVRIGETIVPISDGEGTVRMGGIDVRVSDPATWVLVYRVVDPDKAALLASLVGGLGVRRAAARLGLDAG